MRPVVAALGLLLSAMSLPSAVLAAPTVEEAAEALASGSYAAAEESLKSLASSDRWAEATLLLARLQLETGRYAEADKTAMRAAGHRTFGLAATTLRGEAQHVRGLLDEAEQTWTSIAAAPGAHRARAMLGRLLIERGRRSAAIPHLMALIHAYNQGQLGDDEAAGLAYVGMAARALRSFQDANDAFNEAAVADNTRAETHLEWAALFAEKLDRDNALKGVSAALARNEHHPRARAVLARLIFEHANDFEGVERELSRALDRNPKLVMAHVTRAAMALRNMDIAAADGHLDTALSINPRDLEALSTRAAVRFLADDDRGFAAAKKAVLRLNPTHSAMYGVIARYAEWEHRYPELVEMARAAIKLDPEDPMGHTTLGMNLLRMGDEKRGLAALHDAWDLDRFNVRVFNMLNFYDEVVPKEYVDFQAKPFTVRVHHKEREILEPYLGPMLRDAYAVMRKHYGFDPKGPLRIEMYASPRHFAIRTSGLPNIGVQGVCFGKVVTAVSPEAGEFNWGQIVWHELAHVFHLQLSNNHVPRWFTEGLAEHETIIARPEWHREDDYKLWLAVRAGRLPPLAGLNAAFTNARDPSALMTAYYAASLAVGFIVEQYGFARVRAMLAAWGKGMRTERVFTEVLGEDLSVVDAAFRAHLAKRLSKYDDEYVIDTGAYGDLEAQRKAVDKRPDDLDARAGLALSLMLNREGEAGLKGAREVLASAPKHPIAHFAMALYAVQAGKHTWAKRCLSGIIEGGRDGYDLRLMLAQATLDSGDHAGALEHVEAALTRDRDGIRAWKMLLKVSEVADQPMLALRAMRGIVRLDQHDRISHVALMAVLAKKRDWTQLAQLGEDTLFIHPASPEVHQLLGRGYLGTGRAELALREFDHALSLGHPRVGKLQLRRTAALLALGKRKQAEAAAAEAVAANGKLATRAATLLAAEPPKPGKPVRPGRPGNQGNQGNQGKQGKHRKK